MAEYLIIKREVCSQCSGTGVFTVHPVDDPDKVSSVRCSCRVGYVETQVSLLDVLERLRFGLGTDDGRSCLIDPRWDEGEKTMSNKCPQCGFPEHESGECPYARPKGEKYDYVEAMLIPIAEPPLSLLVVDFGDAVVMQLQKGHLTEQEVGQLLNDAEYRDGDLNASEILQFSDMSFAEARAAIDAHFAESKPVPRIEQDNADQKGSYVLFEDADTTEYLAKDTYDALNELARQAGATRDLPIYEPKGKWRQLLPFTLNDMYLGGDVTSSTQMDGGTGVKIYRYER